MQSIGSTTSVSTGRAARVVGRDPYSGTTVYIHNAPYTFERRLGSGGFGNRREDVSEAHRQSSLCS